MERGWKPNVEISPNCPRCGSSNTKFCYYNNYSLTQPRYFCKGCRRYWTKGGSLRNVPVGGGCRKNRRGKSVRLSSDHASKSLAYEVGAKESISHSYGSKVNSCLVDSSTSSSIMQDGSHIDLALVYANFLNQQPYTKTSTTCCPFESIVPELPGEFDPSLDFSIIAGTNLDANTVQLLPEENGLVGSLSISDLSLETHLRDNDQTYYSTTVFDSVHKRDQDGIQHCTNHINIDHTSTNNQASPMPPLPTEDQTAPHHHEEILWLNSQMMINHHSLQATTQEPMLGPDDQAVQDPNLLFGNWSPFDFSSDDTFSKT